MNFISRPYLCALIATLACLFAAGCAAPTNAVPSDQALFGKSMHSLPAASPNLATTLGQQQCPPQKDVVCLKTFTDYDAQAKHKALAIPVIEAGVGWTGRKSSPELAYLAALYHCNHPPGFAARLCDVQTVDGKDIRAWASAALETHRQGFAALTLPSKRFFGSEEVGGGWIAATTLRTGSPKGVTPSLLEGVTTFYTQDLVRALMGPNPPLVIDVGSSYEVIPTARSLFKGGLAFDKPAVDKAYEARFAGLLNELSPDLNKPVVFYCRDSECWFSVNAALRAKRLGYAQVGWYRGGIHSWAVANLPVATPVVKATLLP